MRIFIQTFDDETWNVFEFGWKKPTNIDGQNKTRCDWTLGEKEATVNAKALKHYFC